MSAEPDLRYSDVEETLRDSVRAALAAYCPWPKVLAHTEGDDPHDRKAWAMLAAEMGLAGLLIPESMGGAGAGPREAAVVLEELGRAVAPVPFLGSAVVATQALLLCGESELLPQLAAGTRTAALVLPFSTSPFAAVPHGARTPAWPMRCWPTICLCRHPTASTWWTRPRRPARRCPPWT